MKKFSLASVLFFALVALLQLRPVDDLDTFAQIRLGQIQLECFCNPPSGEIAYTLAERLHLPNPGWLAQVIFALLYNLANWPLVKLFHDACLAAALVLGACFFAVSQRGIISASLLALLTLASNTSIRPQVVAFAAMSCLTVIASSRLKTRTTVALAVPLFLIWQNSHPSLMIGFVWLITLAAARLIQRGSGSRAPGGCSFSTLMVLSAAALVLQLATPETFGVFAISQDNFQIARNLLRISEWLPPWDAAVRSAMTGFWLTSAITFYLAWRYRRDLSWESILPAAVFWLFSLYSARLSFFLVPAAMPLWVSLGSRLEASRSQRVLGPKAARSVTTKGGHAPRHAMDGVPGTGASGVSARCDANAGSDGAPHELGANQEMPRTAFPGQTLSALCACFAGFVLWQALLVPARYHQNVPVAAIERLQKAQPSGRIYNYREWAGPLVLASAGKWTVAIDGRLYLYPPSAWRTYENAALGRVSLVDLTSQFRPDAFFLHRQFHSGLIELLNHSPDWEAIYRDQQTAVFVPHTSEDASSAHAPATREPSAGTVRIGAILDLTGPLASMGTAVKNGIELAVEQINHNSSLSLEILIEDAHGNPNEAVSAAHKLIDVHGVRLIIGPLRSSSVLAVAPITEQKQVIVFSPTASAAEISLAGDYVFRNRESGEVHGQTIAKFLHQQDLQKVAIFTADSANSRTYSDEFQEFFSRLGGRIVASTSYDPSQRDFRTEVAKLRSVSAQAVYVSVATGSDAAVLVRQLREGGFRGTIAGSPAVALQEFLDGAGAHAEGVIVSAPAFDVEDPTTSTYAASYMRRYGYPSDVYAANAYDAQHILARAVLACGGDETGCVRDFLYRLKDFSGASGLQSFDPHGDIQRQVSLLIVRNGKYESYPLAPG